MKKCSSCGATYDDFAMFCNNCEIDLPIEDNNTRSIYIKRDGFDMKPLVISMLEIISGIVFFLSIIISAFVGVYMGGIVGLTIGFLVGLVFGAIVTGVIFVLLSINEKLGSIELYIKNN